jgi:DNA-binding NarL/FixJ family response regulator
VLIADPHASFRSACKVLLRTEGLAVDADLERHEGAERVASTLHPDVTLIDVSPDQTGGLELARRLSALAQPPAIVLMSRSSLGRDPGQLGRSRPLPRQGRHQR